MVFSVLVKPLVPSLIEAPARKSALQKRRLAASALMATALALCTTAVDAEAFASGQLTAEQSAPRSLHKRPAAPKYAELFEVHALVVEQDELQAPGEAPRFEWFALAEHRKRHRSHLLADPGAIGFGARLATITSPTRQAFLHFGSGSLRSGAPSPL